MIYKSQQNKRDVRAMYDELQATLKRWQRGDRAKREAALKRFQAIKYQIQAQADANRSILSIVGSMCGSAFGSSPDK